MTPDSASGSLDAVIAEYLKAVDAGTPPDRSQFLAAHPEHAAGLQSYFADLDRMERLGADPDATIAPSADAAGSPMMVRYFGDYELLEEIARGGMGVVYKARQVSLNRLVALKMILSGNLASPQDVQRFRAEAEAAANLDHPNILPIYEVGEHQGQHYFSMKYIDGGTFAGLISKRDTDDAVKILASISRAVHFAHQRGILHRDLKPSNILLDADGTPYVTDFGLAKRTDGDSSLTQSGAIVGTPSYMAPEQARSEKQLTTAVDVYALGAILYEALAGRPPFKAATPIETIRQVIENEPTPPRSIDVDVDRDLETVALRCLEKDPDRRCDSASAFADELDRWGRGEPILARPVGMAERAVKWIKRKPLQSAIACTVAAAAVVVIYSGYRVHAQQVLADKADAARKEAESLTERIRHLQSITTVERDLMRGDVFRADQRLKSIPSRHRGWEWNLLQRRTRLDLTFHVDPPRPAPWDHSYHLVNSYQRLAFLPGGRTLGTVRDAPAEEVGGSRSVDFAVWDLVQGKVSRVDRHVGPQNSSEIPLLVVSRDGRRYAHSHPQDRTIVVRDVATGAETAKTNFVLYSREAVTFSPDGRQLAGVVRNQSGYEIVIWDLASDKAAARWQAGDEIRRIGFFPDGSRLVGLSSASLVVWDATSGAEVKRIDGMKNGWNLAVSPGEPLAATAEYDRLALWDLSTGNAVWQVQRRGGRPADDTDETVWEHGAIASIAFSPDGKYLAGAGHSESARDTRMKNTGAGDDFVRMWDAKNGKQLMLFRGAIGEARSLAFNSDGRRIAWCGGTNVICSLDLAGQTNCIRIPDESQEGSSIALSPDGRIAAVSCGTTSLFDTLTGRRQRQFAAGMSFGPMGGAFSSDGKLFVGGNDGKGGNWKTPIWDVAKGQVLDYLDTPGQSIATQFSPDDRHIVTVSSMGFQVWDAASHTRLFDPGHEHKFYCASFSPDGKFLAAGGKTHANEDSGHVQIFDTATWKRAQNWNIKFFEGVTALAWGPDGQLAVSMGQPTDDGSSRRYGNPNEILVIDSLTGAERLRLAGHAGDVNAVLFSPDGSRIISGSSDRTVKIWDAILGLELLTLTEPKGGVSRLALSRDGSTLMATGERFAQKRELIVWHARPLSPNEGELRQPLRELVPEFDASSAKSDGAGPSPAPKIPINAVVNHDRSLAAIRGKDVTVKVIDGHTGEERHSFGGFDTNISAFTFSPDGKYFLAAGGPVLYSRQEWDSKKQKLETINTGHNGPGVVRVWDLKTGQEVATYKGHTMPVSGLRVAPDGSTVVTNSPDAKVIHLWEITSGKLIREVQGGFLGGEFVAGRFTTRRFAGWGKKDSVGERVFFDTKDWNIVQTIPAPATATTIEQFTPDGQTLFRGRPASVHRHSDPGIVEVIDVASGRITQTLQEPYGMVIALQPGPNEGQLSTICSNRALRVWDLATGRPVRSLDHGQTDVMTAQFGPEAGLVTLGFSNAKPGVWFIDALPELEER